MNHDAHCTFSHDHFCRILFFPGLDGNQFIFSKTILDFEKDNLLKDNQPSRLPQANQEPDVIKRKRKEETKATRRARIYRITTNISFNCSNEMITQRRQPRVTDVNWIEFTKRVEKKNYKRSCMAPIVYGIIIE